MLGPPRVFRTAIFALPAVVVLGLAACETTPRRPSLVIEGRNVVLTDCSVGWRGCWNLAELECRRRAGSDLPAEGCFDRTSKRLGREPNPRRPDDEDEKALELECGLDRGTLAVGSLGRPPRAENRHAFMCPRELQGAPSGGGE
jgi:hypothetical protein